MDNGWQCEQPNETDLDRKLRHIEVMMFEKTRLCDMQNLGGDKVLTREEELRNLVEISTMIKEFRRIYDESFRSNKPTEPIKIVNPPQEPCDGIQWADKPFTPTTEQWKKFEESKIIDYPRVNIGEPVKLSSDKPFDKKFQDMKFDKKRKRPLEYWSKEAQADVDAHLPIPDDIAFAVMNLDSMKIHVPKQFMNLGISNEGYIHGDTNDSANWRTFSEDLPPGRWRMWNRDGETVTLVKDAKQPDVIRFTADFTKVMKLANKKAHVYNHEYIGTEHLLLGLAKDGSTVLTELLTQSSIRTEIEKVIQHGPHLSHTDYKLPQTPRAKNAIKFAFDEARRKNCDCGPNELLVGLFLEEQGIAAQILGNMGLRRWKDVETATEGFYLWEENK